jgi:peptidyl-prolyl cis-trans isomerase C
MRLTAPAFAALLLASAAPAWAGHHPAASPAGNDPVVATIGADTVHMSDVQAILAQIPPQSLQGAPPDLIYGKLLENAIDQAALAQEAKKAGLGNDPEVKRQIASAVEKVMAQAQISHEVKPKLSEDAVKAVYDQQYAHKPGEPEIHARHILVNSEAKAKDIIAQLNAGAKFEDLAKANGDPKDPSTQRGGDLDWFKRGDMVKEFSDVAFALKKGEISQTPAHSSFGWHVIQVLDTRVSQPPSYESVRQEIQQQLVQTLIGKAIDTAKKATKVSVFNSDGTPVKAGSQPKFVAPATPAAPAKK